MPHGYPLDYAYVADYRITLRAAVFTLRFTGYAQLVHTRCALRSSRWFDVAWTLYTTGSAVHLCPARCTLTFQLFCYAVYVQFILHCSTRFCRALPHTPRTLLVPGYGYGWLRTRLVYALLVHLTDYRLPRCTFYTRFGLFAVCSTLLVTPRYVLHARVARSGYISRNICCALLFTTLRLRAFCRLRLRAHALFICFVRWLEQLLFCYVAFTFTRYYVVCYILRCTLRYGVTLLLRYAFCCGGTVVGLHRTLILLRYVVVVITLLRCCTTRTTVCCLARPHATRCCSCTQLARLPCYVTVVALNTPRSCWLRCCTFTIYRTLPLFNHVCCFAVRLITTVDLDVTFAVDCAAFYCTHVTLRLLQLILVILLRRLRCFGARCSV